MEEYNSLVPIFSKNKSDNVRKKRKLAEALYDSIITGYELDCNMSINNHGMRVRTFFLEDGEWITLDDKEFSEIYNEVWKRLT